MSKTNIPLVVVMSGTIALCVTSVVLSSIASRAAAECTCKDATAYDYSMYTAVVCALSAAAIGVALGLYIYREPVISALSDAIKTKSQ